MVHYEFEIKQPYEVEVHKMDSKGKSVELIGKIVTTLGDILGSFN